MYFNLKPILSACRPLESGADDCISFCPLNCVESELCLNEEFTCPSCVPGWKGNYCDEGRSE